MAADFRLGVQSFCFREFQPLSALIDSLDQLGLEYVEIWPGHLDFKSDARTLRSALTALEAGGISMESYGTVGFGSDEEVARKCLEFCRQAGLSAVTTGDVEPAAYGMMEELCDEYDINLALHNHGRDHRLGTYDALEEVFGQTSERFGLCLDTAWALDAGEEPLEAVDRFGERLYGVHLKDFVFDDEGKPEDVIIGTGELDLPGLMEKLDGIDYDGYLSLEYEANPQDPFDEVRECAEAARAAIASVR